MQLCLYFTSDNIIFRKGENKSVDWLCFALFCHFANCMQKEQTKLKNNNINLRVFLALEVVKS